MKLHNLATRFCRKTRLLGTLGFAAVLSQMAFGSVIPIQSTGVGLSQGQQDPNYTLTVNYLNNGTSTFVAQGATVAESQPNGQAPAPGWPIYVWPADGNAQWISPQADVVGITGVPMDTQYVYQTTFSLAGLDPTTAQLSGFWTADNYISQVQLNGNTIYSWDSCAAPAPNTNYYFQYLYPFSITSGFQSGVNTLSFAVTNSNCYNDAPKTNPTGLFVDISGTADPLSVPEPGTLFPAAFALGFGFIACFARKRKTSL